VLNPLHQTTENFVITSIRKYYRNKNWFIRGVNPGSNGSKNDHIYVDPNGKIRIDLLARKKFDISLNSKDTRYIEAFGYNKSPNIRQTGSYINTAAMVLSFIPTNNCSALVAMPKSAWERDKEEFSFLLPKIINPEILSRIGLHLVDTDGTVTTIWLKSIAGVNHV